MNEKMTVQWFPGHMAKTRRLIKESLSMVDAVCELVDARIPESSRNPELDEIVGSKPRIVLLNKCDLADPNATARKIKELAEKGVTAYKMSKRLGIGQTVFKRWLIKGAMPETANLIKLALVMDESVEYLLGLE